MRCFVTGVAGFVGSHLAERLLADGHEVCGIDSFADDYDRSFKEQNLEGLRSWSMFRFIEGDLMEVVLQPMLEGVDWVFHQAGQEKGRGNWATAFTNYTQSNVLITLRLLEAALRFGWIQRFVYASSSSVYGKAARLPIQEDALERPHSAQGVAKLAAESLCSLYYRRFGLPAVSLRYFSVYGPRQRPDMAFHRFCKAIVCHEPLYLYGDGYQTRDFTYVEDVVEANIRAAVASEAAGQVINIGSGTNVTLRSIVGMLEEISGSRIKVVVDNSQQDDVRHICADTQRAQQLLGYRPCVELRDGLAHEFEFIRRLYEHWPNSAARGAIHQGSSDDGPMSSKDSTVTRKATLVNLTDALKPQTSQADNHLTEPIDNTAQRMELQTSALANARQEPQAPQFQFHVNVPSDKEDEHAKLISSAKMATLVGLAAVPTVQMSQADSHVAESMADVEQRTEGADDYAAVSKATAANLTAVLEPETRQADSQTVSQTPQISQADSHVAESIADVEQRTGPQVDTRANVWQWSQALQFRVNMSSDKQSEHVKPTVPPRPVGAPQAPTGPWVPPNRLARPAPSHAEQNHMRVAIIALLLVGLLILGGCLAVYTQVIGNPSAVTDQAGAASSAAITITTYASKTLENTFSLTAVIDKPDPEQRQIWARQVFATTQPVSKSVQVTSESTYANTSTGDASQPTSDDQNTTTSSVVQQSNIDAVAKELEIANMPSAAAVLQPQLAQNEQLAGNPQCQSQISADHKSGDIADWVTVTVVFSCSGEAYDRGAAEKMAAQELSEQAKKDIGNLYTLSGQITTTVKNASISDASKGMITVSIDARGTWVLQLYMDQQRAWANSLAGKTKEAAQSFLLRQKGVKRANILLQGGGGRTLPTDARKITIKVQPVAGS